MKKHKKLIIFLKFLLKSFYELISFPIFYLPGPLGYKLRYNYYRKKMKYLGENVKIDVGVSIINPEYISIGSNTWIDKHVILLAGKPIVGERKIYRKTNNDYTGEEGELIIANDIHIAPFTIISGMGGTYIGGGVAAGSKIYSLSHHYRNLLDLSDNYDYNFSSMSPQKEQALISGPVVLESNSAIGLNSVLLPGVTIGKNSWIGAGSVVHKNIPSNVIASGNPAKVITKKF